MLTKTRGFILLTLALTSGIVLASPVTESGFVKQVYPLASGEIVLVFSPNPTYCNQSSQGDMQLSLKVDPNGVTMTALGQRNIYAAALTALALTRAVAYTYDNASTSCPISALKVQ